MHRQNRHGFTMIEAAVCVAALGVAGAATTVGMTRTRSDANLAICAAKLGAIGAGNAQFALTHNGKMAGFLSQDSNGRGTSTVHAAEAVGILRSRGRPDMPTINGWVPDPGYWSLSLVEFQNRSLSDPFNVCPSDDFLNKWRRHPAAFDAGRFLPFQPPPSEVNKRWPYSSSYDLSAAAYDINQSLDVGATNGQTVLSRLYQGGNQHNTYTIPGTHNLGPSQMSLVAMPSRKVHVFERHQRHFGKPDLFFMYPDARTAMLFFDGSVRVERSADVNPGWNPNLPGSQLATSVVYAPGTWEPPVQNPVPNPTSQVVVDSHRWTRSGLLGWDYLE